MPDTLGHGLFLAWLGVMVAFWALILAVAVVGWTLPKVLTDSVFREPHFRPAELGYLGGFPMGFIRTFMLMRLVANPASGRRRGLVDVHRQAPAWFSRFARVGLPLFYGLLVAFASLLLLMGGMAMMQSA